MVNKFSLTMTLVEAVWKQTIERMITSGATFRADPQRRELTIEQCHFLRKIETGNGYAYSVKHNVPNNSDAIINFHTDNVKTFYTE